MFEVARKELFTAVVGDVMDKMGLLHQFLPPQLKPLKGTMFLMGSTMTVLEADTFESGNVQLTSLHLLKQGIYLIKVFDKLNNKNVVQRIYKTNYSLKSTIFES